MRYIDADKLKAHYAWWGDYPDECPERAEEKKELFEERKGKRNK